MPRSTNPRAAVGVEVTASSERGVAKCAATLAPGRHHLLERRQFLPRPLDEVFAFFADAANLERITPPWLRFRILTPSPIHMKVGALIDYRIRWKSVPLRWRTRIAEWNPPHGFVDVQERGPYALWHHTHTFEGTPGGVWMTDRVRYALPLGALGRCIHAVGIRRDVHAIFDYRRAVIERAFAPAPG